MNKTKDMTVGSPTKTIFFFSVPVLLGTLFQQIYNMADTIIVGQFLGEDALAAVGATGSTVYLVIGFASGLTQGCGILVSQAFGGHRLNELKKVVGTALLLTVVFSVILTIPTVSFSRQILLALHTPSNVLLYAHEYLRVIFGGILCTMAYNIAASILRSLGDSRTPLYFLILSSFLNIVLDIFFIATLHMGTAGAAWATVLSQGISALLCFWYMFHNYNNLRLSIRTPYLNVVKVMLLTNLKIALGSLLIIPGIYWSYCYMQVGYLMAENPYLTTCRAMELSKQMMDGEKWNTFVLQLSFIGWYLLCSITFGIGFIFLEPYVQATFAELYAALRAKALANGYTNEYELGGFVRH